VEGLNEISDQLLIALSAEMAFGFSSRLLDLKMQRAIVQPTADLLNYCSSMATRNTNGTDIHKDGSDLHQCNHVAEIDGVQKENHQLSELP
jgi:hypothetical protein